MTADFDGWVTGPQAKWGYKYHLAHRAMMDPEPQWPSGWCTVWGVDRPRGVWMGVIENPMDAEALWRGMGRGYLGGGSWAAFDWLGSLFVEGWRKGISVG